MLGKISFTKVLCHTLLVLNRVLSVRSVNKLHITLCLLFCNTEKGLVSVSTAMS